MKQALLGAVVTKISGTEFDDGGRVVKITLEDGFSFNVPEGSPLLKKITEGYELDLTYERDKANETTNQSGAKFTFHNISGVKIMAVREGVLDETIAALPDVAERQIVFKKVGGGTAGGEAAAPARV